MRSPVELALLPPRSFPPSRRVAISRLNGTFPVVACGAGRLGRHEQNGTEGARHRRSPSQRVKDEVAVESQRRPLPTVLARPFRAVELLGSTPVPEMLS